MFFVLIALVITFRVVGGSFDGDRIARYIREMDCELISRKWDPFGPGWFGERACRIYEIVYRDRDGKVHRAHVKTSMMTGVYLTNDRIIEGEPKQSVEEEKAELRKRLSELEKK